MAHAIQPKLRFSDECPKCATASGHVRMAGTVLGQPTIIRLTLTCDACLHEWVIDTVGEPQTTNAPPQPLQDTPYR